MGTGSGGQAGCKAEQAGCKAEQARLGVGGKQVDSRLESEDNSGSEDKAKIGRQ